MSLMSETGVGGPGREKSFGLGRGKNVERACLGGLRRAGEEREEQ